MSRNVIFRFHIFEEEIIKYSTEKNKSEKQIQGLSESIENCK